MFPIFLAQQELPKLRGGSRTLQKLTVVEGEESDTCINKNSSRYNVMSSKSVPTQSSMAVLGRGRIVLAAGMMEGFRMELMLRQDEILEQRKDGADPRPEHGSAGFSWLEPRDIKELP